MNFRKMSKGAIKVIKEIDVVVVNNPNVLFFILQFPNKPSNTTLNQEPILSSRLSNLKDELEIHVGLDPFHSSHYDQMKGEIFGKNYSNIEEVLPSKYLEKKLYKSQHTLLEAQSNCFVGVFKNGVLYLIPIRHLLQMRPVFNYLDKSNRKDPSDLNVGEMEDNEIEMGKAEIINVKFTNLNIRNFGGATNSGLSTSLTGQSKTKILNDTWEGCEISKTNFKSLEQLEKIKSEKAWTQLNYVPYTSEHVEKMIPSISQNSLEKGATSSDHTKPTFMAQVIPFNQIWRYALQNSANSINTPDHGDISQFKKDIINYLVSIADLVAGSWVIKSEYIFPCPDEDTNSESSTETLDHISHTLKTDIKPHISLLNKQLKSSKRLNNSNVISDPPWDTFKILRQCRDFILFLFDLSIQNTSTTNKKGYFATRNDDSNCEIVITRQKLNHFLNIRSEDVQGILKGVALLKPKIGWVFKFDRDTEFINSTLDTDTLRRFEILKTLRKTQIYKNISSHLSNSFKSTNHNVSLNDHMLREFFDPQNLEPFQKKIDEITSYDSPNKPMPVDNQNITIINAVNGTENCENDNDEIVLDLKKESVKKEEYFIVNSEDNYFRGKKKDNKVSPKKKSRGKR
ncbi:DNA-directed RNA polymerase III subunit RPC5-like isoform X3 [Gordionus sp. m RMFG-2023]|uniref:DNA-directed RNA polymerase III subunit RPC5-like isoform X3 n=1 Tax=Gordionus sp. m RMFG-2023 TaxID=3053472 RepID=UPI0031FCD707